MPPDPDPLDVSTRPRRRLPMGVLGMLALVACVEMGVMNHDYDLTTLIASNWQIEGRTAQRHAASAEILCFGDSMVKFGIQPKVLSAGLGKSAYNLALYCGPPQASYYLLDRAFDAGAKPTAILVDFQPEFLMGDSIKILSRTFPELLTFPETLDLCLTARRVDSLRTARDASRKSEFSLGERLGEFTVAKLLPSARKRYEIRAAVMAAIKGNSVSVKDRLLAGKRNWKINRGAEALPKNPHYRGEIPEVGGYPAMFWAPWTAHDLNVLYLERFLDLAKSRNVPVFWVLQPNAADVDARREKVGYNGQYESFVRAYQDRYANLNVIDGRHVNYPYQVFTDPVHLDREGAAAETLGVVDILKAYFADPASSPRWASLPDRRDGINSVKIEDFVESGVIMKAELDKVRR